MKEYELRNALRKAAENCQLSEYSKRQIIAQAKGEEPVKKKLTVSVVLVMVITLLTLSVAVALIHSTILSQLYGENVEAPEEVSERIQRPQQVTESTFGTLSLDEWFYDGMSIHTAFSISNPTSEPLFYTLDGIHLNDEHVTYNRLKTEGAGDSGFLLGGTVDGTSLPSSVSLYNQGDALHHFHQNGKYAGTTSIPEGTSTLKISVAVWRPIHNVEVIDYKQYEGINTNETKEHLTVDKTGYGQLWLFRPEKYNLNVNASQSGAQVYKEAYKELGWLELLDTIEVEMPVLLNKENAVRAIPEAMEFSNNHYQLELEQFDLSHAGGQFSAWIYSKATTEEPLLPAHGFRLVDLKGQRMLCNGCYWDDQTDDAAGLHVGMPLIPTVDQLPDTVTFAPAISYIEHWDPASPKYDGGIGKPANVIDGWELDLTNAIHIPLEILH